MVKLEQIADSIARHQRLLLILVLGSLIVPLYFIGRVRIDNSIEVWLDRDSQNFIQYQQFLQRYGSEEFVVVAAKMNDPLAPESLVLQQQLAEMLGKIGGVAHVFDLPGICKLLWNDQPGWKGRAQQSELFGNMLLSSDERTMGMFIYLDHLEGPDTRRSTIEVIEAVVTEMAQPGFDPHLAGTPVMNVALDVESKQASITFLPIAIIISIIVLTLMLRSVAGVLACMCAVGITVLWTIGLMGMAGKTMNMVTVVLPSLLFILALSNAIHLGSRYLDNIVKCNDRFKALQATLRELIKPALMSSVTTSVGFASLMISDMHPVADFGMFAAVGMLISLVSNLIVVPGLLLILHRRTIKIRRPMPTKYISGVGVIMARKSWIVLPLAIVVFAGCVLAVMGIKAESNVLKFFPEDSHIARAYSFVGKNLTGFYTVELDIHTNQSHELGTITAIKRLGEVISNRSEIARVDHIGQLMESFPLAKLVNREPAQIAAMSELAGYITRKYRHQDGEDVFLRLSVMVRAMESSEFYSLLEFTESSAQEILPTTSTWNITGVVSLLNDVQRQLVETQIKSFSLAALLVIILIGLFTWSLRAGLAAILPNLLPVFAVFALMAIAQIPLDSAAVMIASVAIGIAADDTIHFLARYQKEKQLGQNVYITIENTLTKIGRAIVFTSVVAAAGFSILTLAQFRPIAHFGLLTGITMLTALAADLLVLPGCIKLFRL